MRLNLSPKYLKDRAQLRRGHTATRTRCAKLGRFLRRNNIDAKTLVQHFDEQPIRCFEIEWLSRFRAVN